MFYIATFKLFEKNEIKLGVSATQKGAEALIYIALLKEMKKSFFQYEIDFTNELIPLIKSENYKQVIDYIYSKHHNSENVYFSITEVEYITEKELLNDVEHHLNDLLIKEII